MLYETLTWIAIKLGADQTTQFGKGILQQSSLLHVFYLAREDEFMSLPSMSILKKPTCRFSDLQLELDDLRARKLYRTLRTIESAQGPVVQMSGRSFLLFSSNNYLGLANHPEVIRASVEAIQKYGVSSGASRLISGNMTLHEELESKIAQFKGTEAAIVFSSGYMTNLGAIPALVGEKDFIVVDKLNHASLIDGCRLSGAAFRVYPHKNLKCLKELLEKRNQYKRVLIVTDSVFSMDGDVAPIPELLKLAEKYDAWLMMDEAHATGVLGKTGRGALEHFNLRSNEQFIQMGTFSKALGSFGGFIAGSKVLIEYLKNTARTFFYSTSLPPGVLAASIKAIEIVDKEPERLKNLWGNVTRFRKGIEKIGAMHASPLQGETPIIPILTGENERTLKLAEELFANGIFVPAVRPPTVAKGRCRLRFTVMATHTQEQIERCLEILEKIIY